MFLAREGGVAECARLIPGAAPELAEARLADPRLLAFAAPQRFLRGANRVKGVADPYMRFHLRQIPV